MKNNYKYNLLDMTFLIPIRVDGMVRIENMLMSIHYLLRNFKTNIVVLHASGYENGILPKILNKKVKYIYIEDKDPVFYQTKYLNLMTKGADTHYVAIGDTDVIIPHIQIIEAVDKLREGYDVAYPYDGSFYDTTEIIREQYWKVRNLKLLTSNVSKMKMIYGDKMKGGAMFINREAYIKAGMENERFYGWGPEDFERYERWKVLGYRIYHSKGNLYHLTHGRGSNSNFRSLDQVKNTNFEVHSTRMSSKDEIINNNL